MVYLFFGSDNFSKRARLQQLTKQSGTEIVVVRTEDGPLNMAQLTEATLFGGSRLFVLEGLSSQLDPEKDIPQLAQSDHIIVLLEDVLDKRKKTTTQLLKHPDITVQEFTAPQGSDLQKWLLAQAGELEVKLDAAIADYLIAALLPPASNNRFAEPAIDLYQLHNELQKLVTYADGKPIDHTMIDALVVKNGEIETWDIINALGERNMKQAFIALEKFFDNDTASDDKAKTIQLNALLADQFRSILMTQDFIQQRAPDAAVLEQTGWKSGRLFIMKKLAGRFKPSQLVSVLDKLEKLDIELKSTTTPGQVILQLIAAQLS